MEDKPLEIIIDNLANRLVKIKTTCDRLLITLIILSIFGHLNKDADSVIQIPVLKIDITAGLYFLIFMSAIIIATFAVIGSNLIDYFTKRALLDLYVARYRQRFDESYKNITKDPSIIFVHNSFYEYLYRFESIRLTRLHFPASAMLWLILIYSQYVIFLLLTAAFDLYTQDFWIAIGIAVMVIFPMYLTFFSSIMRAKTLVLKESGLEDGQVSKKRSNLAWIYSLGFLIPLLFFILVLQILK